jgi:hypothetical protein
LTTKHQRASGEWRHIADDREKYRAYLCSREWALLRNAVRERCGGKCERCNVNEMDCVHHLTYARKYAENLDDLAGWCNECHEFTHGKSDVDPMAAKSWVEWCDRISGQMDRGGFMRSVDRLRDDFKCRDGEPFSWIYIAQATYLGVAVAKKMGIKWLARAADGEFFRNVDDAELEEIIRRRRKEQGIE